MPNDHDPPEISELSGIGRDHHSHRASRGWINEAFLMCAAALGLGAYDVATSALRNGYPTMPGFIAFLLFTFAVGAVVVAFRALGSHSTYPDRKRRSLRKRLIWSVAAAGLPLVVGIVGQIVQVFGPFTDA